MSLLTTRRLRLRLIEPADEALYVRLYTDPETLERIGPPQTVERARAGFLTSLARDHGRWPLWVMVRLQDEAHIGLVGLDIDTDRVAEIGAICPPAFQGQGYAREAAMTVVRHAFLGIGLDRVEARHVADHPLVEAVMRGMGFHPAAAGPPPHPRRWTLSREQWKAQEGDKVHALG
ncbi:hypothetical protein GCM10011521_22780 [Arenimonas soli]|uniref:N-acetyltransferase domain-containing protein n=1 Tax=Arenimonas soli TaxID=2269504 RepID=A0ABQ1HMZ2_9GAMM|nr:GNAT family N-acetyltransferase [Arenimonas soli]GGA83818.1 hypothetical protein GCM10011521_22780 [Arenimonas soli]